MSETNKALARRFYEEVLSKKNLNAIDELCAPNIVDHFAMPGQSPGAQGLKEVFAMFTEGFPDMQVKVEELIAERDLVVARFTVTATHKGTMFGAPPTGKNVTVHGMDMLRIQNGKCTEVWHHGDEMMVLAQLGVKPPM